MPTFPRRAISSAPRLRHLGKSKKTSGGCDDFNTVARWVESTNALYKKREISDELGKKQDGIFKEMPVNLENAIGTKKRKNPQLKPCDYPAKTMQAPCKQPAITFSKSYFIIPRTNFAIQRLLCAVFGHKKASANADAFLCFPILSERK